MPEDKTNAEAKANANEIEHQDAAEPGPRGNVQSHDDEKVDQDAPPPLPG